MATIYVPYLLSASNGSDAAVNDLDMFHKLISYKKFDPQLARAALEVLGRHTWYLQVSLGLLSIPVLSASVQLSSSYMW